VPLRLFIIPPSAMVTDHLPHGDGLVAWAFIRELAVRGHVLHVAAGGVDVRQELPATLALHRLEDGGAPGGLGRLRYMRRVRGLYSELSRSRAFDLVHQLNPVEVGVSLALADQPVPLVLGPYIPDWAPSGVGADRETGAAALQAKRILRAAQQRQATGVLMSTPAAASKLAARRGKAPAIYELSAGVDEALWRPPARETAGQDVLFLANLEARKGIHVLLDAFERVANELPGACLLVAGEGPEEERVRRRLRDSPALRGVRLLGRVPHHRVAATMQACHVYCLPSYGEPFGMTALEAMACARPVVATNTGGLRHLVPDGGGIKVAPGDAAALAAALRKLLVDPGLRRAMGEHNRRVVEERYAWGRVGDRLESVYREAMA
jgi:glycosyltransferase involved in cell wall biosynthesis